MGFVKIPQNPLDLFIVNRIAVPAWALVSRLPSFKERVGENLQLFLIHFGYNRYSYYYKIQGFFCILTYIFRAIHFEVARTVLWLSSTRLHDWIRSFSCSASVLKGE